MIAEGKRVVIYTRCVACGEVARYEQYSSDPYTFALFHIASNCAYLELNISLDEVLQSVRSPLSIEEV